MSTEQNKELYRRLTKDVWNAGKLEVLDQLVSPDFVDHEQAPGMASGAEGVKQLVAMVRSAFPDLHVSVNDLIAEGDKVVALGAARGTHLGPFMGLPPSGKPIRFAIIDVFRCANGRFVEHWGLTDMLGLMQQVGAIQLPQPDSAPVP